MKKTLRNWLLRKLARPELDTLYRYRIATDLVLRWNGGLPQSHATAQWIHEVGEARIGWGGIEAFRDELRKGQAQAGRSNGRPDRMTIVQMTNEHAAHVLLAMRHEQSMMGVPMELAALDAAIASLSAPQPPAEAQPVGIEPWPRFILDEALAVLRNVDTQFRATGQPSARVERLINLLAGMEGRTAPQPPSAPVGVPPALTPEQAHEMAPGGLSWDEAGAWAMGYEACRQRALAQQPAPSAPVGVEWPLSVLRAGNWREVHVGTRCMRLEVTYDYATWERLMEQVEAALAQKPAAIGEEIMVNAAHDVYTLPLHPSGLSSGPRFVVHVPAPEQPAAVECPHRTRCDCLGACKYGYAGNGAITQQGGATDA